MKYNYVPNSNSEIESTKDGGNTVQQLMRFKVEYKDKTISKTIKIDTSRVVQTKFIYSYKRSGTEKEIKFVEDLNAPEPTITVNTKAAVSASNRYKITDNQARNPTIESGDQLTYCIRYYSIGTDDVTIDQNDVYVDRYGEGLEPINGINVAKDSDGKNVKVEHDVTNRKLKIKPNTKKLNKVIVNKDRNINSRLL